VGLISVSEARAMRENDPHEARREAERQPEETIKKLPIERDLEGPICPSCGSRRYSLFIRMVSGRYSGLLAARCSRCREPRMLIPDEFIPRDNTA